MKASRKFALWIGGLTVGLAAGCAGSDSTPPPEASQPGYFELGDIEHFEITNNQSNPFFGEDTGEGSGEGGGENGNWDPFPPGDSGGNSGGSSGGGSGDSGESTDIPDPDFPEKGGGSGGGTGDDFGFPGGGTGGGWPGSGGGWGGGGFGSRIGAYDLVSVGLLAYQLVESNQPKVLSDTHRLSILPLDPADWEKIEGWTGPHFRTFVLQSKNLLGMTVLDFQYKVIYYANGNLDGHGAYIANLQVVPEVVNVRWGFKFDSRFEVGDIINSGSRANPMVGAHFQLQWRLHSQMRRLQGIDSYYLKGDSDLLLIK